MSIETSFHPVKQARIVANLQAREVADKAAVSLSTVSKMENGIPVSEKTAKRVLSVYGLNIGEIEVAILPKLKRIRRR